jgi:hypothetical protein
MKKTRRTAKSEKLNPRIEEAQKKKKKKKACLHLSRQEAEQNFAKFQNMLPLAAASRIFVEYVDFLLISIRFLLISVRSAAAYGRRKAVAVVLLAATAFRRFPHAEIFSFCRSRFFPFMGTVVVLAAVVASALWLCWQSDKNVLDRYEQLWPVSCTELTKANYEECSAGKVAFIKFFAPWYLNGRKNKSKDPKSKDPCYIPVRAWWRMAFSRDMCLCAACDCVHMRFFGRVARH